MITGDRFRWAALVLSVSAVVGCNVAGAKDKKKDDAKSAEPVLAEDAVIGSCMAKDDSFCEEYRNRQSIRDNARTVELTMTKGMCESDMKKGVWRDGKACEAKGEIGHCVVDKYDAFKKLGYVFKGDEEVPAGTCDLTNGKWESAMTDDVLLGRCVVGNACTELRNNKNVDVDGRARGVKREQESCERLEGTYEAGKACETAASTSKCTKKAEYLLTELHFEAGTSKEELKDAKELCDIGGSEAKFETLTPAKK